jgi:HlyD family secretion protein
VTVKAPAAGTVLRVPEYSERIVNAGQPLIELGNAAVLEVVIDVLSTDAVRIQPGMPATLTGWGGVPLAARVRKIEPAAFTRLSALGVEEQRVNVILDFDNCPDNIGDGYHIQGSIVVWSSERVLTVPTSALFTDVAGWSVFVIEQGRARKRSVQIGEHGRERAQVISGLAAGDRVILFPSDQITDGALVRPER